MKKGGAIHFTDFGSLCFPTGSCLTAHHQELRVTSQLSAKKTADWKLKCRWNKTLLWNTFLTDKSFSISGCIPWLKNTQIPVCHFPICRCLHAWRLVNHFQTQQEHQNFSHETEKHIKAQKDPNVKMIHSFCAPFTPLLDEDPNPRCQSSTSALTPKHCRYLLGFYHTGLHPNCNTFILKMGVRK